MTLQQSRVLTPTLVADQVYEIVSAAIFNGELAAGSRLRVRDLADMCGTSVMPVRDALGRLQESGLVATVPHKGAVVREFTVEELLEIYHVRTLLEVDAARVGAGRLDESDVVEMRAALERMQSAVEDKQVSTALDEDENVLRVLYRSGGNSVLLEIIENLWARCRAYKVIGARVALAEDDNSLWTPQPALVDAVSAGDVDGAVQITHDSLTSARKRLVKELIT